MRHSSADEPASSHGIGGEAPVDWAAQDWEDLMPRLLLLAFSRLARLRGGVQGAGEAEDFVSDAISKTMAGVRVWNREACTLFQHLAGVVVSEISHSASSSERRLTVSEAGRPNGHTSWPPDIPDDAPDQEQRALWLSEQRRLLEHLAGVEPILGRMAELMLARDICETRDLCDALGLAPSEVANLRKRLKRAVRAHVTESSR